MLTVDLRSDTVTQPTEAMYEAMRNAPLGDDVLGDEPTVGRLQEIAAKITGKEAALYVPSGTMSNQIALATHCQPGDAALFEDECHMVFYESGSPATIAQVMTRMVPSERGIMDPSEIEKRVMVKSIHTPGTTLLCLENTHNRAGGRIVPMEMMRAYRALSDKHGLKVHLDGARMFNATVALGIQPSEIAETCDTVSICLSKGLGSPVGSVLCGPANFIAKAKYVRKRLGGGMRQAGVIAACGIVSLETMIDRLSEDHARAKRLGTALQGLPGTHVPMDWVETNFVMVTTDRPAADWLKPLAERGIRAMNAAPNRIRLVLHHQISDAMVDQTVGAFHEVADLLKA